MLHWNNVTWTSQHCTELLHTVTHEVYIVNNDIQSDWWLKNGLVTVKLSITCHHTLVGGFWGWEQYYEVKLMPLQNFLAMYIYRNSSMKDNICISIIHSISADIHTYTYNSPGYGGQPTYQFLTLQILRWWTSW